MRPVAALPIITHTLLQRQTFVASCVHGYLPPHHLLIWALWFLILRQLRLLLYCGLNMHVQHFPRQPGYHVLVAVPSLYFFDLELELVEDHVPELSCESLNELLMLIFLVFLVDDHTGFVLFAQPGHNTGSELQRTPFLTLPNKHISKNRIHATAKL